MANTNKLKEIERHVRVALSKKYRVKFEDEEIPLDLITGGKHRFDVVSKDRTIVGGVKSNGVRRDGTVGAGPIRSTYTELYFLSLIKAKKKMMVFTNKDFYNFFKRRSKGKVLPDVKLKYCKVLDHMFVKILRVNRMASEEIGKK